MTRPEGIRLPAQIIGDHRRLGANRGDHRHPHAAPLHGLDQAAQIAVARKDHHVVEMRHQVQDIDRHLDIDAALHPPAA